MNFNSLEFLILFLPVTFVAFYAVPMRLRLWVLVAASLVFYGVSGLEVLLAFLIAIFWGYGTAFLFGKWPRRLAIIVAILVPGLILIMFKYMNFILDSIHAGPQARDHFWFFLSILLPAGISFYTFEIVSYSLDVADGKIERDRDLLRFTSFATFFPHLIAGPIMRYARFATTIADASIHANSQTKYRFRLEIFVDWSVLQNIRRGYLRDEGRKGN